MSKDSFSQLAAELLEKHLRLDTKQETFPPYTENNKPQGLIFIVGKTELLKALTAAHNKAILGMLDNIEADIKACSDCPKDESPSIHLFKYRAELTNERAE